MTKSDFKTIEEKYNKLLSCVELLKAVGLTNVITAEEYNDCKDWIGRLRQPQFNMMFTGTFNAGKSTIINAFMGRLLLPYSNQQWTAKVTLIRKSPDGREGFKVTNKDKTQHNSTNFADLGKYISKKDNNSHRDIELVEIFLSDWDFDPDIVIVDTPGFDADNDEDKRITNDFLTKAHACVICFDSKMIGSADQGKLIEYLVSNKALTPERRFWAINKWDTLEKKEQDEAADAFKNLVGNKKLFIEPEKLHKISAGTYLAQTITNKPASTLEEKSFADAINLRKYPFTDEVDQSFRRFRGELISFLTSRAKQQFFESALTFLNRLIYKINEAAAPLLASIADVNMAIEREKRVIYFQEGEKIYSSSVDKIDEQIKQFLTKYYNEEYWNNNLQNSIIADTKQMVKELINDLDIQPEFKEYVRFNKFDALGQLLKQATPAILSKVLQKQLVKKFYDELPKPLLDELQNILAGLLSQPVMQEFTYLFDYRLLQARVNGLVDFVSHHHTIAMHELGKPQLDSNEFKPIHYEKTFKQRLEVGFSKLFTEQITLVINDKITHVLFNYFAALTEEAKNMLKEHKYLIISSLTEEQVQLDQRLTVHTTKIRTLSDIKKLLDAIQTK